VKADLDQILQDRGLDALVVVGPDGLNESNAAFHYFVGRAHLTGTVIKRRGRAPILLHSEMERDAAHGTGLETVPVTRWPLKEIFESFPDQLSARVELHRRIFQDLEVTGRIVVAGVDHVGPALAFWQRLRTALPGLEIVTEPDGTALEAARMTKDAAEIAAIERAGAEACEIVDEVRGILSEAAVQHGALADDSGPLTIGRLRRLILERVHERGLQAPEGFILSANRDAGVPHSSGDDAHALAAGDVLLLDFYPRGPEGYWHDVTRTWSLGAARPEVQSAHDDVRGCFELVLERIRPGVSSRELQSEACTYFEERGHASIRQDPAGTSGYVHSLGHGLGLEVHERPHFPTFRAGQDAELEPGMVVTIEPGLYYPERGFGVRIEDTVLVTESGARSLSPAAPDLEIPIGGFAAARGDLSRRRRKISG
jgi:Xaa-Pro aminopeptidase